ncbi:hypothetical protein Amn_pc00520 (plasmid) [Aminobacter sp. Y103A]|uniref:hypothetical protein n=1 Tax=Phyllobacteriaceae TaxID=69277 RepID=UPI0019265A0B|nr:MULTISPECIES: hypothetical protein [Phyllobacteriaceae]BBD41337.1 hypothetical protein Amn_pc00520 [Aminobacter sp. SS-2016]BCH20107.1 hypothetical protein MesoLjLa_69580 [Mesorhizobium sp. L-2-11]
MRFFADLNKRLSDNIYRHGHYLTRPHAGDRHRLEETVELLMPFVRSDEYAIVKSQILGLINNHKHEDLLL